jgi:plasmid stabilization system protein ParE
MKLRYTSRAKDDLDVSLAWYERQLIGLGHEFLACVEVAGRSIMKNPKMYRQYYFNFHGCVVRRFPFVIFYTIEETEIVVHSVFDSRRDTVSRLT